MSVQSPVSGLSRSPSASSFGPGRRSHPNLQHLSLAPLAPKYPIEPADYSPSFDPSISEMRVSALPSPGGILSHSPSSSRANSRVRLKKRARSHAAIKEAAAAAGPDSHAVAPTSGAIAAAAHALGHHTTPPRPPTSRSQLHLKSSDWIVQAGLTLTASSRENKGQSWIVQRDSSTSLASLHITVDEPVRDRQPRSVPGPAFSSRPVSRQGSRPGSRASSRTRRSRRDLAMTSVADPADAAIVPLVHFSPDDVRPDWADPESQAEIAARVSTELSEDDSDPYGMLNFEDQFDIDLDSEDEREVRRELMASHNGWFDGVIDVLLRIEHDELDLAETGNTPSLRRGVGLASPVDEQPQHAQHQQQQEEVLADDQVEPPPDHPQTMWEDVKWFGRLLARTVTS
ncbi:hypothetical protein DV735_g415, partial [Chaetothyriales sp. CBS 134920]